MYWRGKVDGPNGERFSFYASWVSTDDDFEVMDGGYLIVIKPASGKQRVWISAEEMKSLEHHDPATLRISLLRARADNIHEFNLKEF